MEARAFLRAKLISLAARARRLARVDYASVGIRPQDLPFAPSPEHFRAANRRLALIDREIRRRLAIARQRWATAPIDRALVDMAVVERELDRARRAFGLFFELFSQRGSSYAPVLAAHDAIAADCYTSVRQVAPELFRSRLLKPLSYMEHGYSPATLRRGVVLSRLLGEANPFPVIRIPWDRDNPWQAVFLHEVSHNLQADLGIWQENRAAVMRRSLGFVGDPLLARIWGRWHKEIFADLAALLLGGPAAAWGMAIFLAHPAPRALTFRPGSAHPTGYLRIFVQVEMLRRMGFQLEAARMDRVWRTLYDPGRGHRLPPRLLTSAGTLVPQIVDEIAFQTRRNLAQRALVDIIRFDRNDQSRIKAAARELAGGRDPSFALAPRHLVSAASYALNSGRVPPRRLSDQVVSLLVRGRVRPAATLGAAQAALAA